MKISGEIVYLCISHFDSSVHGILENFRIVITDVRSNVFIIRMYAINYIWIYRADKRFLIWNSDLLIGRTVYGNDK